MGYEVDVKGTVIFHDIEGFKEAFEKIAQRRDTEVGLHDDYDYFFTKMWGDHLEKLDAVEGTEFPFKREGKFWFDDEAAMKLLSQFAKGTVKFHGQENYKWEFDLDGNGNATRGGS